MFLSFFSTHTHTHTHTHTPNFLHSLVWINLRLDECFKLFWKIQSAWSARSIDTRWIPGSYEGHLKATRLLPVSRGTTTSSGTGARARPHAHAHAFEWRIWPAPCRSALTTAFFKQTWADGDQNRFCKHESWRQRLLLRGKCSNSYGRPQLNTNIRFDSTFGELNCSNCA